MMRILRMPFAMCLTVALFAGLMGVQTAQADERKAAVEARQKAMKAIGGHMKAIGEFLKAGKGTAEEAAAHADSIQALSSKIPGLFEVEAVQADGATVGKNRAKPEIWSDWAGFETASSNLGKEAGVMAAVLRGGDADAYGAAMETFGGNGCGACHKKFRGPKEE